MATTFAAIATATLTSSSGLIQFSSIPQSFKHLWITGMAKSNDSSRYMRMAINGSNGASYNDAEFYGPSSGNPVQYGFRNGVYSLGVSESQNNWGGVDICIPNYSNTSNFKPYLFRVNFLTFDTVGSNQNVFGGAYEEYNAAVTSLGFFFSAGTMAPGTKFTLYGLS